MMYTSAQRKALRRENSMWPEALQELNQETVRSRVSGSGAPTRVWRSRKFLVQMFEHEGHKRLTVSVTDMQSHGDWTDGIPWEDLQRLKHEAGFGEVCAVEIYPPDADVVNVANMRHLWLMPDPPPFMWSGK